MAEEYVLKKGEVGTIMEFTLKDADGAVNLNGWTVTMSVKKGSASPVIDEAACSVDANQTTNKGKGTYEWTNVTANIDAGKYNMEFKAVNPGGDVYYFPKTAKEPFAILKVIEPLS